MKISSLPSYTEIRWYSLGKLIKNLIALWSNLCIYNSSLPQKNRISGLTEENFQLLEKLDIFMKKIEYFLNLLESNSFGSISFVKLAFQVLNTEIKKLPNLLKEGTES